MSFGTNIDWVNAQWCNSDYNKFADNPEFVEFYNGDYRVFRSFFWNVIKKLISDYYGFERESWEWSKKIVWSNLYKIAPDGRNPNWQEMDFQKETSFELVRKEIEEINPKFCIVLTNLSWWQPFGEALNTIKIENKYIPAEIESVEMYNNTKIIVTKRPRFGDSDYYIREILKLIK